jgi:RimJ/RimL family protein N-acetyltransferase
MIKSKKLIELETARLTLRQWREEDKLPLYHMCSDPSVMRYFPAPLLREQSDELFERASRLIDENGWGFWAVELKESGEFIGFVGMHFQDADSGIPCAPLTEIGWRLSKAHWRKGYASEAALEVLQFAFSELDLAEVYAFTTLTNTPSQQVMLKIGMENTGHDFDHPKLEASHPLVRHCLYKISRTS